MSTGPMRITDDELAREVEALKSHRRLSVNRPVLDPDLPDLAAAYGGGQELLSIPSPERERRGYSLVDDGAVPIRSPSASSSSSLSPGKGYSNERARFTARRRGQGSEQSTGSEPSMSSPTRLSPVSASPTNDAFDSRGLATSPTSMSSTSPSSPKDPSHLFWVPASVHPEISPTDFRNFIKEHAARAVTQHEGEDDQAADDTLSPLAVGESPIAQRLNSVRQQQQERQNQSSDARGALIGRSTSLSRRGSTLRRQYRPENDTDETDEDKASRPLQRNRSGLSRGTYGLALPNLTIDDLQKLEAAAEEASQSQDPAMLRSVLRRTLSLNTSPDMDTIDAMRPSLCQGQVRSCGVLHEPRCEKRQAIQAEEVLLRGGVHLALLVMEMQPRLRRAAEHGNCSRTLKIRKEGTAVSRRFRQVQMMILQLGIALRGPSRQKRLTRLWMLILETRINRKCRNGRVLLP